jgi:hypothetical protein
MVLALAKLDADSPPKIVGREFKQANHPPLD